MCFTHLGFVTNDTQTTIYVHVSLLFPSWFGFKYILCSYYCCYFTYVAGSSHDVAASLNSPDGTYIHATENVKRKLQSIGDGLYVYQFCSPAQENCALKEVFLMMLATYLMLMFVLWKTSLVKQYQQRHDTFSPAGYRIPSTVRVNSKE